MSIAVHFVQILLFCHLQTWSHLTAYVIKLHFTLLYCVVIRCSHMSHAAFLQNKVVYALIYFIQNVLVVLLLHIHLVTTCKDLW